MPLLKTRPTVQLLLPPTIHPGDSFVAKLIVHARRDVAISEVSLRLDAADRIIYGKQSRSHDVLHLAAVLSGPRVLRKGKHELRCRFDLPPDCPPSLAARTIETTYTASAVVRIPWWLDRRSNFSVPVRHRPVSVEAKSGIYTTRGRGSEQPYVEWSVDDYHLRPGKTLRGAIAFGNLAGEPLRSIRVSLLGQQTSPASPRSEVYRYTLELPATEAREGKSIPFRMKVPNLPPTAQSRLWRLEWWLEVSGRRGLLKTGITGRSGLVVLPEGSTTTGRGETPAVGTDRAAAAWAHVAASLRLEVDGDAMVGRVGRTEVVIRRELRHRAFHLVGELQYPSLQIALDGGRLSGFQRYVATRPRLSFATKHYASSRHLEQARALFAPLERRGLLAHLADVDDTRLELEQRGLGQNAERLRAFADEVLAVARSLEASRDRLPPPDGMEASVPQWESMAQRLDGRLEMARMAIFGRLDLTLVEIVTEWDESEAVATWAVARLRKPVRERYELEWTRDTGMVAGDRTVFRGRAREIIDELLTASLAVRVGGDALEVALEAPLRDPAVAIPTLEQLVELGDRLLGRRGPYR